MEKMQDRLPVKRAIRSSLSLALVVYSVALSPDLKATIFPWPFSADEGERLSRQLIKAAKKLRNSDYTEVTILYSPKKGVDQHYRVAIADVRYQPAGPSSWPYSGLTVWVDKGQGGFCNAHVRQIGVPRALEVKKFREPAEIVLRKVAGEIQVIDLR